MSYRARLRVDWRSCFAEAEACSLPQGSILSRAMTMEDRRPPTRPNCGNCIHVDKGSLGPSWWLCRRDNLYVPNNRDNLPCWESEKEKADAP